MSDKQSFEFNPLFGSMFPGNKCWGGDWSEDGGAGTHAIVLQQVDGAHVISFRKYGASKWTHCDITFAGDPDKLRARSHKGYVVFKGNRLNIWLNYAKGHEDDSDYARYDIKPRSNAPAPF